MSRSFALRLLEKFPDYDHAWPESQRATWWRMFFTLASAALTTNEPDYYI